MVAPARFTPAATTPCPKCRAALRIYAEDLRPEACARCGMKGLTPGVKDSAPKRDGSHTEEALYAALDKAGYIDLGYVGGGYIDIGTYYQRGFPWGLYINPRRRFQADAAFPAARLLIEVDGIAHKIGSRQKGDVLKSQLAQAAGWRVLHLLPEQVHDGAAIELVRAALARREACDG